MTDIYMERYWNNMCIMNHQESIIWQVIGRWSEPHCVLGIDLLRIVGMDTCDAFRVSV